MYIKWRWVYYIYFVCKCICSLSHFPSHMMFICILLFKSNRLLASKLKGWAHLKQESQKWATSCICSFVLFMMIQSLTMWLHAILMPKPSPIQLSAGCFSRSTVQLYTVFILFSLVYLAAEGGVGPKTEKQLLRRKLLWKDKSWGNDWNRYCISFFSLLVVRCTVSYLIPVSAASHDKALPLFF